MQAQNAGEERRGDGDADEQRGAAAQDHQHDDDDEQDGGDDAVLQLVQHDADVFGLVLREGDVDRRRPGLLQLLDDGAGRIHRLDEVRAGPLRHLDGDRRLAVDAADGGRVLEGRADLGDVAERDGGRARDGDREFQDVFGILDQRRHLHREAAGLALQRAGGDQAVAGAERGDQLFQRNAVALQEHRLGDDLDDLVAVAAQIRVEHARHLLDRDLGLPGKLQERALRHVAAERDHEHREQREIDLVHLRLVGVARQLAPGVVDLGAHVGDGHVGIEAGLEFQQHVAAALEGGGAHLLDVLHRGELRLQRAKDQPLGVLRADAALRDVDVDDRDGDVRLRLLGDGEIGGKARHQQEEERREGQPRMADRVVDGVEHSQDLEMSAGSATCTASTTWPSLTKSWPCTITSAPSGTPATQISSRASSTIDDGHGADEPVGADDPDAELAFGREGQGRARNADSLGRLERQRHLRGHAVGNGCIGIVELHVEPVGAGLLAGGRRDEADDTFRIRAGHQLDGGAVAFANAGKLALRHFHHGEHRIERDDHRHRHVGLHGLAGRHRHVADHAGDRRANQRAVALGLGLGERRLGGAEVGLQLVLLVGGDDAALDQLQLRLKVRAAHLHHGLGLGDLRLARLVGEDGDDVAFRHHGAAADLQLGDRAGGARHGGGAVVRFGAAGQRNGTGMRLHLRGNHRHAERRRRFRSGLRNCGLFRLFGAAEHAGADPQTWRRRR